MCFSATGCQRRQWGHSTSSPGWSASALSAVDISAVTDLHNFHDQLTILDAEQDAPVAHAVAVDVGVGGQFLHAVAARVFLEVIDSLRHASAVVLIFDFAKLSSRGRGE